MGQMTLILGGAYSGKSSFAESRFASNSCVAYIATLQPSDDDMKKRIAKLRKGRPDLWSTIEAPLQVPQVLRLCGFQYDGFLIDSITHYIWNLLAAVGKDRSDDQLLIEVDRAIEAAEMARAPVVMVSSEVGGSISTDAYRRRYQHLVGRANQRLFAAAHETFLLTIGQPQKVK